MNEILNTILTDTYTLTQLKHRLTVLKMYLLDTFFAGQKQQIAPWDLNWLKTLPPTFWQQFNKENVYHIFTKLEEEIKLKPILTMYLTFEPDQSTTSQIGTSVRKNFGPVLLDIKFDPNLIAGTALVWKGIYKDFSLKSKIEQRKEEIIQSFKKFLR